MSNSSYLHLWIMDKLSAIWLATSLVSFEHESPGEKQQVTPWFRTMQRQKSFTQNISIIIINPTKIRSQMNIESRLTTYVSHLYSSTVIQTKPSILIRSFLTTLSRKLYYEINPSLNYSGDLNTRLVWCSNGWKLSDDRMVCYLNAIWIPD